MASLADMEEIIKRSDSLYKQDKLDEAFDLLTPYADGTTDNPEMLWRLVRMYYRKSKATSDNKEAERLAKKGLDISQKAKELGSENFLCIKWAGIILSTYSALVGNKEKLRTSSEVKGYFERAFELSPEDMAVNYLIGRWHFNVAAIPGAARWIYSNVPSSTYQEALVHFERAEKYNQEDYIQNWLFLGKTHYQLSNKAEARKWLSKVMEHGGNTQEIKEAKEEAGKLLKKV